jgi:hypothetical protein
LTTTPTTTVRPGLRDHILARLTAAGAEGMSKGELGQYLQSGPRRFKCLAAERDAALAELEGAGLVVQWDVTSFAWCYDRSMTMFRAASRS